MKVSRKIGLLFCFILFLVGTFFQVYFREQIDNREYYSEKISSNLKREILSTLEFHKELESKHENLEFLRFHELFDPKANPYFIFKSNRLIFWSTQSEISPDRPSRERVILINRKDEQLILVTSSIDESEYFICSIIPLVKTPSVQNQYLSNSFNEKIFNHKDFRISVPKVLLNNFDFEDRLVLSFEVGSQYSDKTHWANLTSFAFLLLFTAILLFISFDSCKRIVAKGKMLEGLALFTIPWLLIFVGFKLFLVESTWQSELLDPIFFSYNEVLINNIFELLYWIVFILCVSLLVRRNTLRIFKQVKSKSVNQKFAFQIISVFFVFVVFYSSVLLVRLLYHHSLLSLDINESLEFGAGRWTAILILVLFGNVIFLLTDFLKELIIFTRVERRTFWVVLASAVLFLLVFTPLLEGAWIAALAVFLFFLVSYVLTSKITFEIPHYEVLMYFLFVVVLISSVYALVIQKYELERSLDNLNSFASTSLIEKDAFGEFLLNEAHEKIGEDPFISNWMSSPFISKELIANKIRQVYLGRYFDKYDVTVLLYNQAGNPFDVNAGFSTNYHVIKERFAVEENSTDYEDVFELGRIKISLLKRYITFIEVKRRGITTGYVILDLDQKILAPRSVYPELLVDSRIFVNRDLKDLSYAVYTNGSLLYDAGNFNYANRISTDDIDTTNLPMDWVLSGGFLHLGIPLDNNRVLVVSAREPMYYSLVSNFSFLFFVAIIATGIFVALRFVVKRFWLKDISYSTRLQMYFNVAFFVPLLLVSITTISTLNNRTVQKLKEEYRGKSVNIAEEIQQELDKYLLNMNSREDLRETLTEIAKFQEVDVNLYSSSGKLIVTTQPEIYNKNLLNMYSNPQAVIEIIEGNQRSVFMNESLGGLKYNSTYTEIRTSDTARMIGIVGLPNFDFNTVLEEQQIGIISNALIIFSFIFLMLAVVSYIFSKKLTQPLKTVAEKLKRTSLTDFNEPLEWQTNDEIGLLIREYNRMVENLEKSKEALERNQKELAWRNIARQVAHEIKNPLTPMKLTLQMMQKQLSENGERDFDSTKFKKSVSTLLHQIEILSDIASSFSAFAKMPMPEAKRFEVTEAVVRAFNLYKDTENVDLELNVHESPIYVVGDQKMMGRILTNIILNAIQAAGDKKVMIVGDVKLNSNGNVIISIEDNGPGIADEIREKIFMPYFSTKPEGTGIGLAMAKHGIDQTGGQIWFDSSEDGTKFFIELPVER